MRRRRGLLLLLLEGALSLLAWMGISAATAWWTLMLAVLYLLHPLLDPRGRIGHWVAAGWGRGLIRMAPGCRIEISGWENIPPGRPVIFMANHQSYVDVPTLFFLPGPFKWMADEGLFRIPIFGWALCLGGHVSVRRGDPRAGLRSMEQAKGWLARKVYIFVFPEGTRSHAAVFGRFQTGGFRLAGATGTPIVPVVLVGTRQHLPRGSWIFRWGMRLKIRILPAVGPPPDAKAIHPLAQQVRAEMAKVYREQLKALR